ncbi:MAG: hypothetical protein OQJ99_01420 [Rhodospirillales bacterium]|nr:hypothetical protein [Rhodospirillales bacterium]MCW8862249.1 hypothetical protein [Rhodospirillales bacterium]MCW8952690.1 hypothetical protein [Rhodospirillales bacterium]MCW8970167.1 hypothetical protein [Rhodospirillales bacterium]MCW9001485.1 hypothetical protein [Rhodospirillales bacterium]
MSRDFGISRGGMRLAMQVKEGYRRKEPLFTDEKRRRILMPEHLLNRDLDLESFEDPLPLALVAARDPEGAMALSAATRLSPKACGGNLIRGVYSIVGETTRHDEVSKCVNLITESAFDPDVIHRVHSHVADYVVRARKAYSEALRANLRALMDGDLTPRKFVRDFFELTEAGNLRFEIRKKLVNSLLLSKTVRPGIKFLFLENLHYFPEPVYVAIIEEIIAAPEATHLDPIKEELRWMLGMHREGKSIH